MLKRGMPKIVDPAERRKDIVDAVFRIICADGLERVSLREVADEAGLAVGSVRHYFASSDEMLTWSFAAVVDRVISRLDASLVDVDAVEPGSAEYRTRVLALLCQFLPLDEERAVDSCVWLAFKNAARIKPTLGAEADRSHRRVAAVIGHVISGLTDREDDQDLVVQAEHLLATLDGLAMHALLQSEWMSAQVCHDVLGRHLDGLGAPTGRGNPG